MSDHDSTLDYNENDLIDSPLSQVLQEDNEQIEILIYRLPDSDWTLEVVNQNGTSRYGMKHSRQIRKLYLSL